MIDCIDCQSVTYCFCVFCVLFLLIRCCMLLFGLWPSSCNKPQSSFQFVSFHFISSARDCGAVWISNCWIDCVIAANRQQKQTMLVVFYERSAHRRQTRQRIGYVPSCPVLSCAVLSSSHAGDHYRLHDTPALSSLDVYTERHTELASWLAGRLAGWLTG